MIAKAGKPLARLVPYDAPTEDRKPGLAAGLVEIAADFDAPLPDDVLRDWQG